MVSGVNAKSAFFASIPGGSMAMANLADKYNAQIPPVAVAHSLRVSILVIAVPYFMTYGGVPIEIVPYKPELEVDFSVIAVWLLVGGALGELSERLHFHNGCFMTPIILGAILTLSGVELSLIPGWMTDFAQLMFGLIFGGTLRAGIFLPVTNFLFPLLS